MEAKVAHLETHTKTLEAEIEALRADMVKLVHYSKSSSQDVEFRDQALKQIETLSSEHKSAQSENEELKAQLAKLQKERDDAVKGQVKAEYRVKHLLRTLEARDKRIATQLEPEIRKGDYRITHILRVLDSREHEIKKLSGSK